MVVLDLQRKHCLGLSKDDQAPCAHLEPQSCAEVSGETVEERLSEIWAPDHIPGILRHISGIFRMQDVSRRTVSVRIPDHLAQ